MNTIETIKTRKSIRGYQPTPVPKEILKEIMEIANRAPSSVNIQPWECTVIAGEVIDNIRQANIAKFDAGQAYYPEMLTGPYSGKYRNRQVAIGVQLFKLMGIGREDEEGRTEWVKRGLRFFDAPAAIIISTERSLSEGKLFNLGLFTQSIVLSAWHYGLGTCIELAGVSYPDVIRKYTGIPESSCINIAVAIGYPDWDFPANKVQSEREPLENVVNWCGL